MALALRRLGLPGGADFERLWLAQTISWVGTGVGNVAGPLVAVVWLGASAWQMGVLQAAGQLPALLLSLFIGVWVDRLPRGPLVMWTDLGRGVLRLAIPILAVGGVLRIEWLYAIAFLVGVLGVTYDIASTTYAPSLVRRDELVDANAKIQGSHSAANVIGPAMAGPLVQAVGAPLVVGLDALSFLVSGWLTSRIKDDDVAPRATGRAAGRDMRREIGEGWRALWDEPVVRVIVLSTAAGSLGGAVIQAVYVLYATRQLGLSPTALGLVIGAYAVAAIVGAAVAGRVSRRLGIGRTMMAGGVLIVAGALMAPMAAAAPISLLAAGQLMTGLGLTVGSITQISVRQALTPSHLLGRVNATRRVMVFGVQPIGALAGGLIGELAGLVPSLIVGIAFEAAAVVMLLPVWKVRTLDD